MFGYQSFCKFTKINYDSCFCDVLLLLIYDILTHAKNLYLVCGNIVSAFCFAHVC